jgi:hypothetical protein
MLHDKKVPKIDGLRVDEAHKGGGKGCKLQDQVLKHN